MENESTRTVPPTRGGDRTVLAYLAVSGAVLLLLMLFGLLMRLAQGGLIGLPPDRFYQLMTAHGIGMVGIAGLGSAGVMWYFLSRHVRLTTAVLVLNLVLFLAGVVMILGAVFLGGFAAAWTFLFPLPAMSGGVWGRAPAAVHLAGLLLIGVGFLLLHLDTGRAILSRYGGLGRALGWPQLFGGSDEEAPPPVVVASTMVLIVNTLGLVSGATILVMSLVNLFAPGFAIDPLLAKNMIFFFGHVFINATIYMAVIGVYEILPRYTGRPWKSSRVFLAAWTASTVMVLIVYPHHLLMDFVMPTWMLVMGQIISYMSGLPVLAVTAFGTLTIVYRSGIRWDTASGLLFLAVFGWSAGVIPAIADGTIVVNQVMHNTLWVPGHFHFYLLLGVVPMVLGFMCFLGADRELRDGPVDRAAVWAFGIGAAGFAMSLLAAGKEGVPRRFAVHLPEWMPYDRIGALFAALAILAFAIPVVRFLTRLRTLGVTAV